MDVLLRRAMGIIQELTDALDARRVIPPKVTRIGSLTLNRAAFSAMWKGQPVGLTASGFRVVDYLASYPEFTRHRFDILDAMFDTEKVTLARSVDSSIKRIRRDFKKTDPDFNAIRTINGQGYLWREDPQ